MWIILKFWDWIISCWEWPQRMSLQTDCWGPLTRQVRERMHHPQGQGGLVVSGEGGKTGEGTLERRWRIGIREGQLIYRMKVYIRSWLLETIVLKTHAGKESSQLCYFPIKGKWPWVAIQERVWHMDELTVILALNRETCTTINRSLTTTRTRTVSIVLSMSVSLWRNANS